mmetsp:Transcript_114/g.219  ORF Transcript_114/g.219 Transcript_114/m.219 type:complete len:250 (+) Transcript_114:1030-1779(+)
MSCLLVAVLSERPCRGQLGPQSSFARAVSSAAARSACEGAQRPRAKALRSGVPMACGAPSLPGRLAFHLRRASSRWKRLRIACEVRPGSSAMMRFHLCPNTATERRMISSSSALQSVRSMRLPRSHASDVLAASPQSLPAHERRSEPGNGLSPLLSTEPRSYSRGTCSCRRFHRVRIASSVLPGSVAARERHRPPYLATATRMNSSSRDDHCFCAGPRPAGLKSRSTKQMWPFLGAPHLLHRYSVHWRL